MWLSSQKSHAGSFAKSDKDRKIGHRRVDGAGQVTYKKVRTWLICTFPIASMIRAFVNVVTA